MSDNLKGLDLIQRYADKLRQDATHISAPAAARLMPDAPPNALRAAPGKRRDAIRSKTAVPIDLGHLEQLGCIRPGSGKSTPLMQQMQLIKRPLLHKAFSPDSPVGNGNIVMVTSARPGEGKSFVTLNLALSIASEHDVFVMVIDGDFYHQALPKMLGIAADQGLVDVLTSPDLDLADVILRTDIDRLTLLPAGRQRSHTTELLASQRMSALMREMSTRYPDRLILVDSPPVLACTETGVLASLVGQLVMIIEQNKTGWRLVDHSLAKLSACPAISFVLNKVEPLWDENYAAAYR